MKPGKQLRPMSDKRYNEWEERQAVKRAVVMRDGYRCRAEHLVPEVQCWGQIDYDEMASRGVYPGGHLDPDNVQQLCRGHHEWKHANPAEALARGLRRLAPPLVLIAGGG